MSTKSPYEILGVPRNATSDQIRRAYLLKVKAAHPDNFDQVRERARWEQANEQLKELNQAYTLLKDDESRANYDRGATTATPPPRRPRSPDWDIKLGKLKAGMAWFANLPKSVQERILDRTAGEAGNQFAISLGGIGWNYFFLVLLTCWLFVLFDAAASSRRLGAEDQQIFTVITFGVALLQAWNICTLFKWHRSPLRPFLIITPLYVIRTGVDRVWYWPIWSLTSVRATHNYKNSSYTGTDLNMDFGEDKQSFKISPQHAYAALVAMLDTFSQRASTAKQYGDVRYFYDNDDFREVDPDVAKPAPPAPVRLNLKIFAATLAVYIICLVAAWMLHQQRRESAVRTSSAPNRTSAPAYVPAPPIPTTNSILPPPVVSAPSYPECPLPDHGSTWFYTAEAKLAPFEISAPLGASCLAKLVDANTGKPVVSVFVHAGSKVEVDVPLGNYILKYAMGEKWYGETHLFGPSTSYGKANTVLNFGIEGNRYAGHTIRLQKSVDGNLRTESISPGDF
jgi:hypothetical protein